jgi:hypothetical protein
LYSLDTDIRIDTTFTSLTHIIDTHRHTTLPFAPGVPDILAWPLPSSQARELVSKRTRDGISADRLTFLDPEFDAAI